MTPTDLAAFMNTRNSIVGEEHHLMTMPGQQELELIKRTLDNLEFIDQHQDERNVWEVTQIINSFLSVLAHPKDRLFDKERMNRLQLSDLVVERYGFPRLGSSSNDDRPMPQTLWGLLTLLRNGVAHGNIDLLNDAEVRARQPSSSAMRDYPRGDIAGIEIWNRNREGTRTCGTVLTIGDMRQCLAAIAALADNPEFRVGTSGKKLGGRREDSAEARELLAGQPLSRRAES